MLDVAGGALRQLTFSGKNDTAPRWSPDGSSIAFVSDRDGGRRSSTAAHARRRSREAHRSEGGCRRVPLVAGRHPHRAPDGGTEEPNRCSSARRDKDDGRVVDKDDRHPRVWALDVASRTLKPVTSGRWRSPRSLGARRRPPGRDRVRTARGRRVHRSAVPRSISPTAASRRSRRPAVRWASWRSRRTAAPSRTSARGGTAPARTISICSLSPAARRGRLPRRHSIGRSVSRAGSITRRWRSPWRAASGARSRSSAPTAAARHWGASTSTLHSSPAPPTAPSR